MTRGYGSGPFDAARETGKDVAGRAGRGAWNAAKTVLKDLLRWVGEQLWRGARYIPVKAGKYLKAKAGGCASWADQGEVPEKVRSRVEGGRDPAEVVRDELGEEHVPPGMDSGSGQRSISYGGWGERARQVVLENSSDMKAARHIAGNSRMLNTAKANPEVVDADSQMEVELKAAAYSGDLDSKVSEFDVSAEEVGEMLGTDLAARAGYNVLGESLPGEISDVDAEAGDGGEADAGGEGSPGPEGYGTGEGRASPGEPGSHIPTSGGGDADTDAGPTHVPVAGSGSGGDSGGSSGSGDSGGSSGSSGSADVDVDAGPSSGGVGAAGNSSGGGSGSPGAAGNAGGAGSGGS
jgi:hypothetical protein